MSCVLILHGPLSKLFYTIQFFFIRYCHPGVWDVIVQTRVSVLPLISRYRQVIIENTGRSCQYKLNKFDCMPMAYCRALGNGPVCPLINGPIL